MRKHQKMFRAFTRRLVWNQNVAITSLLLVAIFSITLYGVINRYDFNGNLDTISYMSIAEQYAEGRLKLAVDTYWSPAVSWVVAVFLMIGFDGPSSFMLLNITAASAALFFGLRLVKSASKLSIVPHVLYILLATPFLMATLKEFTPDTLVIAWVLMLANVLLLVDQSIKRNNSIKNLVFIGIALGLIGAIGYMIKLFLLFYFIGIIALWALYHIVSYLISTKNMMKSLFGASTITATLAFFFLLIGMSPWLLAMSLKYDELVISTSFQQNAGAKFVEENTSVSSASSNIKPQKPRLSPPAHEHAVSNAEGRAASYGSRKGTKVNKNTLGTYVETRLSTLSGFIKRVNTVWLFSIPAFIFAIVSLVYKPLRKRAKDNPALVYTLLSFAVYLGGYMAATMRPNLRYIWPLGVLGMIIACWLVSVVHKRSSNLRVISALVFAIILLAVTFIEHEWIQWKDLTNDGSRRIEYVIADKLNEHTEIDFQGLRLAGNNRRTQVRLSYILGAQTYGSVQNTDDYSSEEVKQLLDKHKIEYFIIFQPSSEQTAEENLAPMESVLITRFTVKSSPYVCRDVRYGHWDEEVDTDICNVLLYRLP